MKPQTEVPFTVDMLFFFPVPREENFFLKNSDYQNSSQVQPPHKHRTSPNIPRILPVLQQPHQCRGSGLSDYSLLV